jgi:hypothetical protein
MLTLAPFSYAVRRALGRRRTLQDMAARSWVIEPASVEIAPRATYIEETLSRVTAPAPFSTLKIQYDMIAGGEVTHLPVRGLLFRRAALVGSSLYIRGHRTPLAPAHGFHLGELLTCEHLPKAALGCTYFGNMFFGHFWTDDVTMMQLGQEHAEPFRTSRPLTAHQRDLLELLGLRPRLAGSLSFDELLVFEDAAQTKSKERRYRKIREAFAARFSRPDPPRGVFVLRGSSGTARALSNEAAIAEALSRQGIVSVSPERMSLAELSRAVWGARLVIGVEGSHLLHGIYNAAEGAAFVALQPPWRFGNIIKNYTDRLGMRYGFVVGEPQGEGFTVSLDEVERVIETIEAGAR